MPGYGMNSLPAGILVIAGLGWLVLLFAVAVVGERAPARFSRLWPAVYALSLAVYCTAWTFYGTTTQAARSGWPIPPTFVGTMLVFLLGWPFLVRLVRLSKQLNSTSIADFIASRFHKSSALAAVVTGVAVLGTVPYIALQLKAVAMSFSALAGDSQPAASGVPDWADLALFVAIAMAVFAVLFGTRRNSALEHNRGLVLAMAFESLFKLAAMLALGLFVFWGLYEGPMDWARSTPSIPPGSLDSFLTLVLLGVLAMFTLPHQFHIGVVECRDEAHLRTARWLFPLFLLLIGLPTLPLARAGEALLAGQGVPSDLYALMLPMYGERSGLALWAFLGGISAASGMVILASLTLSIMIGNHWLTPLLLDHRIAPVGALRMPVRLQRRIGIALVLMLAWLWNRLAGTTEALADIGALSFSGLAQLAPAVVLAVYKPGLSSRAILAGLLAGVAVWAYVLLLPLLAPSLNFVGGTGLNVFRWLTPSAFMGLDALDPLSRAVLSSLFANLALIMVVRHLHRQPGQADGPGPGLEPAMLREIARRFLPESRVARIFSGTRHISDLEAAVEHELAAVVGSASARLLLDAARRRAPAPLETVADLVGQASAQARFSREVLSGALENISQGICVIDDRLRLVAWNRAYLNLFDYPETLIQVGRPVADLLRHNLARGLIDVDPVDAERAVERRLAHKRAGTRHRIERHWPDGRIIEIRGNPMPGGGFVATFTDVTAFRRAEFELKRINETLEQRVAERTAELQAATRAAERANSAKTRFLAAVSHDLVQPLNAAQLMIHSLAAEVAPEHQPLVRRIRGALDATESLLESLLDISRLEAGGLEPRPGNFALGELFEQLAGEFSVMARERGLALRCVPTSVVVRSDRQLLRRILQNFLSNAVRYTHQGRIVLGVRRSAAEVLIGVWDTGPGIPTVARELVFEEFRRLDNDRAVPGLGLGLTIAERFARLLGHELVLRSEPGRGTMFGVRVPRASRVHPDPGKLSPGTPEPQQGNVVVIDNDPTMLDSLNELLTGWGFSVHASDGNSTAGQLEPDSDPPDLLIVDYRLDQGRTGLEIVRTLRQSCPELPVVLITAERDPELRAKAEAMGCELLHKPLRPLALRSLIGRLLSARRRTWPTE
ncbi:MAG: PAS domain-containing hybrid sensor histidine kinase/response regulator [Wenzhouxiangellaceae bacterium]